MIEKLSKGDTILDILQDIMQLYIDLGNRQEDQYKNMSRSLYLSLQKLRDQYVKDVELVSSTSKHKEEPKDDTSG